MPFILGRMSGQARTHTHPHNIHTHVSLNIRTLNEKVALNCALKNYDLSIINGLVNVLVLDEPSLYLGG